MKKEHDFFGANSDAAMWSPSRRGWLTWAIKYVLGFFLVQILWSLLVGDWGQQAAKEESSATVQVSDDSVFRYETPPGEAQWASFRGWANLKHVFAL